MATYVARGNTALSVMMTTASTLAASVMTPLLTLLLAGALVDVPAARLALSTAKFVLIPTLTGVLLNELLPGIPGLERSVWIAGCMRWGCRGPEKGRRTAPR